MEEDARIANATNKELAEEIRNTGKRLDRIRIELEKREVKEYEEDLKWHIEKRLTRICFLLISTLPEIVAVLEEEREATQE